MTLEQLEERLRTTEAMLKEMEKRLRVTEDIEEIKQLQIHYVNCLTLAKYDEIIDCFAEDSEIHLSERTQPTKGKAAIAKVFRENIAKTHVGKEGDILIHPIISVDDNKAKGTWVIYLMYFHPQTHQSLFWVQGFYDMEYVRENGKWKFSFMGWRKGHSPEGMPPDEKFLLQFLDK